MQLRNSAPIAAFALVLTLAAGCKSDGEAEDQSPGAQESASGESGEPQANESDEASASDDDSESDGIGSPIPGGTKPRSFEFVYEATLRPGDGDGAVDIFLPLAVDTDHQKVLEREVESPWEGEIRTEETHGNKFWHARVDELPDSPETIRVVHRVRREVFQRTGLDEHAEDGYPEDVLKDYTLYLQDNERVPTSGELIEQAAKDAELASYSSPKHKARAIYDYVIDTMEYKKVGSGWGNGDTYWACDKEYGNCTDFHALFTSLARHEEIPARFEIGFPVPTDRQKGEIGGYHCWLQFFLPGIGWTPVDASEAKKHPKYREMYFGTQPANRVRFTVGRDLRLGKHHDTGPLNYFIYPHVEVGDESYDGVETNFSYREIDQG